MKNLLIARVHKLTNILQTIIGYLELGRNTDALREVKSAIMELRQMRRLISGLDDSNAADEERTA